MGFFRKNTHNISQDASAPVEEVKTTATEIDDDFDGQNNTLEISREDFHEMADSNMQEAIESGTIEAVSESDTDTAEISDDTVSDNVTDDAIDANDAPNEALRSDAVNGFDSDDDFDFSIETDADKSTDIELDLPKSEPEPEIERKPKMTFSEFRAKHRKGLMAALITALSFLALCLCLYIYGCATVPQGVMGRNIYIEDIDVSNLTFDEALQKVKSNTLLDDCNLTLSCRGKSFTISGIDVGLTARVEETVDKAMRYGKTGNIFIDGFANALQVLFKHTVVPSANVNEQILRSKITEFGNIVYGELVEHQLEVGDGKIICTPGHTGFSGDTDIAYEQVKTSIENDSFSGIRVTLDSAPPKALTIEDIDAFAYANPQDAVFLIENNTVTVVPEIWGRYLDIEEAKQYVPQIYEGGDIVNIPFYSSEPTVKADELNAKLFNATLGSYATSYGGSSANRAANVANAAGKINDTVLAPGDVFSFNTTVGKRSTANGFYTAPEYANGQTVMGVGGGTCQVSTTLYNAVLYSDLSIVSRLNHMFAVGYAPLGQDATVTDSGIDFKFSNNTDYPIKIVATASGGRITVSILGTQRDVPHTVKIQNETSQSEGNRTVRSYRLVYDPQGNLIRKDDLGKSYYMAH